MSDSGQYTGVSMEEHSRRLSGAFTASNSQLGKTTSFEISGLLRLMPEWTETCDLRSGNVWPLEKRRGQRVRKRKQVLILVMLNLSKLVGGSRGEAFGSRGPFRIDGWIIDLLPPPTLEHTYTHPHPDWLVVRCFAYLCCCAPAFLDKKHSLDLTFSAPGLIQCVLGSFM